MTTSLSKKFVKSRFCFWSHHESTRLKPWWV